MASLGIGVTSRLVRHTTNLMFATLKTQVSDLKA
jgi:hypothetical protein